MEAAELTEWIVNSNDAINLNLVPPGNKDSKPKQVFDEPFHPDFTYSVFGDEEMIFGYRDLEINLNFNAHDLRPSLNIQYSDKFQPQGEVKAVEVEEVLKDFLPEYVFRKDSPTAPAKPSGRDEAPSPSWNPPGRLLHSYSRNGKKFEIWCSSLADPAAKEILRGMQILVPFFIEGGTLQNLDDQAWTMERWKFFLLYEVDDTINTTSACPYTFAGFATSYRLWVFPNREIRQALSEDVSPPSEESREPTPPPAPLDSETFTYATPFNPLEAPSRERISQFLIIPPYQGQSHGAHLYTTMTSLFLSDLYVFEITVEDPNEAFDDLRDWCDLARLRADPVFASLHLPDSLPADALRPHAPVPTDLLLPQDTLARLRHKYKISPRQFARLVEMQLLSRIPARHRSLARLTRKAAAADANDRRWWFWRLVVKERVTRQNRDVLAQVELPERIAKVEETVGGVVEEYERILEGAEKRRGVLGDGGVNGEEKEVEGMNGKGKEAVRNGKRRKRVVDEDEDEDEEGGGEDGDATVLAKRPKVAA